MEPDEHIDTAQELLAEADRKFAEDRSIQASEMLWGAAAHMMIAVSQQLNLPYRNHNAMKNAANFLAEELGDPTIADDFETAERFHRNFYHGEMEAAMVNSNRPRVRRLVETLRALPGSA